MKTFKKLVVILLVFVMLVCSFVTTAFAIIPAGVNRNTTLEVEGVGLVCFIENEFYSLFYDDYLEDYYNEYCEYYDIWVSDNTGIYDTAEMYLSSDGTSKGSSVHVNYILENEGSHYVTLFFVCNEGGKYFSAEENGMIAKSLP
ncbi:MAG: hypothetical protein IKV76_05020, partial [Clostridia bacterium]|nr:hypothetical protein [Clostridia bacterium]